MTDTRLATFQRLRKRQADEVGFIPEASPLNAISDDGVSEDEVEIIGNTSQNDRRNVPPETILEDGVEVTGEIIHQGQDVIDGWKDHTVFYRRWTRGEIMILRRAACLYGEGTEPGDQTRGESTMRGWHAIQRMMNRECRFEGQKCSWSMNVLKHRWSVEACSLASDVEGARRLLRRLVFKHGVETSEREGYWDLFHQAVEAKYPGTYEVRPGQTPGELLRETWMTKEMPKIVQTRLFSWLEHEESLA